MEHNQTKWMQTLSIAFVMLLGIASFATVRILQNRSTAPTRSSAQDGTAVGACVASFSIRTPSPTPTPAVCEDGLDNDGDGRIDCTVGAPDPGCFPDGHGGGGACNPKDTDEKDVPTPTPTRSPFPSPIATKSPSPLPTKSPTPAPTIVACIPPTPPEDPPTVLCAPSTTTNGTITWAWPPVANANRYEIDIVDTTGKVVLDNPWRDSTYFNCQTGECTYTTSHLPGKYFQSRVRAHALASGSGVQTCSPSSWSFSERMTINVCPSVPVGQCQSSNSSVVLVIDRSDSMKYKEGTKSQLEWVKDAAVNFVDAVSGGQAGGNVQIGVVVFGMKGANPINATYSAQSIIGLSNNYSAIKTAIRAIKQTDSGTCIECGLRIANTMLTSASGQKNVILMSDGVATHIWDGSRNLTSAPQNAISTANTGRSQAINYLAVQFNDGQYKNTLGTTTMQSIAQDHTKYFYRPTTQAWATTLGQLSTQICN